MMQFKSLTFLILITTSITCLAQDEHWDAGILPEQTLIYEAGEDEMANDFQNLQGHRFNQAILIMNIAENINAIPNNLRSPGSLTSTTISPLSRDGGEVGILANAERRETMGYHNPLWLAVINKNGHEQDLALFNPALLQQIVALENEVKQTALHWQTSSQFYTQRYEEIKRRANDNDIENELSGESPEGILLVKCTTPSQSTPLLCAVKREDYTAYTEKNAFVNILSPTQTFHFFDLINPTPFTVGMVKNISKMLKIIDQKGSPSPQNSISLVTTNYYTSAEVTWSRFQFWLVLHECTKPLSLGSTPTLEALSTWVYCILYQDITQEACPELLFDLHRQPKATIREKYKALKNKLCSKLPRLSLTKKNKVGVSLDNSTEGSSHNTSNASTESTQSRRSRFSLPWGRNNNRIVPLENNSELESTFSTID